MGSTSSTSRFSRLEPDERRRQILACAIELFGERPYSEVSTVELARRAGVARALINHYFGTKREVYLEVIRAMVIVPPTERMILPDGDVEHRVDWFLDWFLDLVERHGKTWLVAVGMQGSGNDPQVREIVAEADDLAAERTLAVLRVTLQEGGSRAIGMARAYGGLVKAAVGEWLDRETLSRAEVHALLRRQLLTLAEALPAGRS